MRLTDARRAMAAACVEDVHRIARSFPSRHSDLVVEAGYVGLVEAAARWDEWRDVPFPVYARSRVRGAMIDRLRERPLGMIDVDDLPARTAAFNDRGDFWRSVRAVVGTRSSFVLRDFFGGVEQATIGARVGVTQSRVAQVVGESVRMLRGDSWFRREFGPV